MVTGNQLYFKKNDRSKILKINSEQIVRIWESYTFKADTNHCDPVYANRMGKL
jgi:hypothetical protein